MLRPLSCVLALLVAVALWQVAVANPDAIVSEISELRRAVGGSGVDAGEFERAARDVVQRQQPFEDRRGNGYWAEPSQWNPGPANNFRDARAPIQRQPTAANLLVRSPDASPIVKLREQAFELDQLAHQLETAAKYDDADAIREAAKSLRGLARKMATKADRPVAAGYQLPAEPSPSMNDAGPLPRIDPPALPPRNLDLMAPPRGVRGGPANQLEDAIEAARGQLRPAQPTQPVDPPPAADE